MNVRILIPTLLVMLCLASWCPGQEATLPAIPPAHSAPPMPGLVSWIAPELPAQVPAQDPQQGPVPEKLEELPFPRTCAELVMAGYGVGKDPVPTVWKVKLEGCWNGLCSYGKDEFHKVLLDYKHMYWSENTLYLGLALGVAAPLANTHADQGIRDWYQDDIRPSSGDEWATVSYQFGKHFVVIPVLAGAALAGKIFEDVPIGAQTYTWGERSLRGLLVGVPAVGLLQVGLGGARPNERGPHSSYWQPFDDNNGVSGHAFVGAVPFLAAASVTENRLLKAAFFCASFFSGAGRIHSDGHYYSQVLLGWSIAYLSVQSVTQTDAEFRRIQFMPIEVPNGSGVGVMFRY